MLIKTLTSLLVGVALTAAAAQLPVVTCIVSNTAVEKACNPGCCANKACCKTSQERTGPRPQPLAKSGLDQQNVSAIAATGMVARLIAAATESQVVSSTEGRAHSLPPLALICIRLI